MVVPMAVFLTSSRRRWWAGAEAVSGVGAVLLLVTGCTSAAHSSSGGTTASGVVATPVPATSTTKIPVVSVDGPDAKISYRVPVKIVVTDGSFVSVQVTGADSALPLEGTMSGDGTSWVSGLPPRPGSEYEVSATVRDPAGRESTQAAHFTVAVVPSSQRVGFSVTPKAGSTVGIGQPVVVRFLTPIKERAAFEEVMTVSAKTPSGRAVTGSWHWLSSEEVHWRPQKFWTPGTRVKLDMKIAGVRAAPDRYGRQDYSQTFTIGSSHVTFVDGVSHRVKVYRDGKPSGDWPGGTGKTGLETYSGTYIVLGKSAQIMMDSCSARITCDKKDPEYYSEKEFWATRITNSGTFLHAASWDPLLGKANVSHGCIHLGDASAKEFYAHAMIGDVVIVQRTGRGPQDRVDTRDPGLYDWNLSWSQWLAGSALR
jgi:lipoprotein-anchoring transpeptidase ErfK/SrfK